MAFLTCGHTQRTSVQHVTFRFSCTNLTAELRVWNNLHLREKILQAKNVLEII